MVNLKQVDASLAWRGPSPMGADGEHLCVFLNWGMSVLLHPVLAGPGHQIVSNKNLNPSTVPSRVGQPLMVPRMMDVKVFWMTFRPQGT